MFGIGGFELFLILLFGFLLFGPDKLPAMAKTIGRGIAKFKAAQEDMNEVLKESNAFDLNSDEPFKDPTETIDKLASTAEKHVRSAGSSAKAAVISKTHDDVDAEKPSAKKAADTSPSETKSPAAKPAQSASPSNPQQESFTERKARYERERAAKLAAEQRANAESAEENAEGGEE